MLEYPYARRLGLSAAGMRKRCSVGIKLEPKKLPENAARLSRWPGDQVHALLDGANHARHISRKVLDMCRLSIFLHRFVCILIPKTTHKLPITKLGIEVLPIT